MKLSNRALNILPSQTIGLTAKLAQLKKEGRPVISFVPGEPDFLPHPNVLNKTIEALQTGKVRYSMVPGETELRELICQKLLNQNHVQYTSEEISLANGSKQTLYNIFQAILNPDDEVIVPRPYWVTIPESIKLSGAKPVFVDCLNLHLDMTKIEKAISEKTKAIFINTPNNPSGMIYSRKSLEKLGELVCQYDLWVISDEAYESLIYGQGKHISIASLGDEIKKRTLTVQSFSKSFAMTGYRLGYVAGNQYVINAINNLQGHLSGNICTFAQYGAMAALELDETYQKDILNIFSKRRELAYRLASEIFDVAAPEGAFYLFPSIEKYRSRFSTSEEMTHYLLDKALVGVVPGEAFGQEGYLRIAFATSLELIAEGFERIKKALM